MWTWIAWLIAAFSSATAVILWLREVRRVLLDKRAIVSVAPHSLPPPDRQPPTHRRIRRVPLC